MGLENKIWFFENLNLTKTLTENEKDALFQKATLKSFKKGEVIYLPHDEANKLFIVKSGKIKISRHSEKGKELILAIQSEGELFGELSITSDETRDELAEALENSEVFIIHSNVFIEVTKHNPAFNFSITRLIGIRLKKIQKRLESLYFKSTEERIRSFIKEMAEEHGRKLVTGDEIEVKLKLKHEDIAKLTATTRQSVTTVLSQLEKDGIIVYDRTRILIKNLNAL